VKRIAGAKVTIPVNKSGFTSTRSGLEILGNSPPRIAAPIAAK